MEKRGVELFQLPATWAVFPPAGWEVLGHIEAVAQGGRDFSDDMEVIIDENQIFESLLDYHYRWRFMSVGVKKFP